MSLFGVDAESAARIFVTELAVMNVAPILPVVLHHIREVDQAERGAFLRQVLATVVGGGVAIVLAGPTLLLALGITLEDLRVAGGVVLLVFATYDLLFSRKRRKDRAEPTPDTAIVPLGVPILLGPAGMTTLLVLAEAHGAAPVLVGFLLNQAINAAFLAVGGRMAVHLGAVAEVAGRLMALVLAALAVSMLRVGLMAMIG